MEKSFIERLKRGEKSALEPLMRLHQDMVYTLALRILKNSAMAEEATQDVFVKVFQKIDSFRGSSKFSTWLYSITYRTCLNYAQKKQITVAESRLGERDKQLRQRFISEQQTSASDLDTQEIVWRAIDVLPALQGVIISLFYLQSFSIKEISEIMDIPENTVKTHLHRGRKELRSILQPVHGAEELV